MDEGRFDRISRLLATRSNRRSAAKRAGFGLATTAIGTASLNSRMALGQAPAVCRVEFVANVRFTPELGVLVDEETLHGEMSFSVSTDGLLENGTLTLDDAVERELSGYAAGPSFSVRVEFLPGRTLILVGVGEKSISACEGSLDGVLTGSEPGAFGDWHATAIPANPAGSSSDPGETEAQPVATVAPTAASGQDATLTGDGECEIECAGGRVLEPLRCECVCETGLTACEDVCVDFATDPQNCGRCASVCASGAACEAGQCSCPDISCSPGAAVDPASCECTCPVDWTDCGEACCDAGRPCRGTVCCLVEGEPCTSGDLCCSGSCDFLVGGGTCSPCLGRVCNAGSGCCGGLPCVAGYCGGCRDRAVACTSNDQCCYSDCVGGACLSDVGGRCARNVDCRACYLNQECARACSFGICGGLDLPDAPLTTPATSG